MAVARLHLNEGDDPMQSLTAPARRLRHDVVDVEHVRGAVDWFKVAEVDAALAYNFDRRDEIRRMIADDEQFSASLREVASSKQTPRGPDASAAALSRRELNFDAAVDGAPLVTVSMSQLAARRTSESNK